MRSAFALLALAGLAAAQSIDIAVVVDTVDTLPDGPDINNPIPPIDPFTPTAVASVILPVATDPSASKRSFRFKRSCGVNDPCCAQPNGYGPKTTPDDASSFKANAIYSNAATSAVKPPGYDLVFQDRKGSTSQSGYKTFTQQLQTYNPTQCQEMCDAMDQCVAFNIYFERDPSIKPATSTTNSAQNCPNPSSITNIKCAFYSLAITEGTAKNAGGWRSQFQVISGYVKNAPPPSYTGYNGPTKLGGAINAPLDSAGHNTYIGFTYYAGSSDVSNCASDCIQHNTYSHQHPAADGTYMACNFFNSYVLSENDIPQGLYCSMYNETWAKSYSTNYGQPRGSDYYGVSESYLYTLSPQDPGHV